MTAILEKALSALFPPTMPQIESNDDYGTFEEQGAIGQTMLRYQDALDRKDWEDAAGDLT